MDPQQQQNLGAAMAGFGLIAAFLGLLLTAFFIFCLWRIFTKAGMAGPMALIAIVPLIGPVVVLCILAFGRWNVVPALVQYGGAPPQYPPPPANYPPRY